MQTYHLMPVAKKRLGFRLVPYVCGLVVLSMCALSLALNAAEQIGEDEKIIHDLRDQSNQALANKDAEKFVSFFDHDYIISYGSGGKTLSLEEETASIRHMFMDNPDVKYVRTPQSIRISASGDLAWEDGTWVGGPEDERTFNGRYAAGWRKSDGVWKIHVELFVSLNCRGQKCDQ